MNPSLALAPLSPLSPLRMVGPGELPIQDPSRTVDRAALARALAVANASYGHPRAAELAAKLADPKTAVVVTGQQPGLLGGPLLALLKGIAAVRWADRYERAGCPAVAVFWMATEDHDWAEASRVAWWTSQGLRRADLGEDIAPLSPVGMRTFGPRVAGVLDSVRESLPGPWANERFDELVAATRPEARFGEAFARLWSRLLGDHCPLMLDAQLPELKEAERPWLRRLVEERGAILERVSAAESELRERGVEPQVRPQPDAGQIFVLRAGSAGVLERRRVLWSGADHYRLRGLEDERPVGELLEMIDANPGVVSPGALSRQAIQDGVFGTTLMILGPGEIAYTAQSRGVYQALGLPGTPIARRPRAIFLEPQVLRKSPDWLPERLAELTASEFSAEAWIAGRDGGAAKQLIEDSKLQVEQALARVRESAVAVDPQLQKAWEKTRDGALRGLDSFAERWLGALGRRDEHELSRLTRLREFLVPEGVQHERVLSIAPAAARWGGGWIQALLEGLDLESAEPSVIAWEETS